jgi:hypothetical protein
LTGAEQKASKHRAVIVTLVAFWPFMYTASDNSPLPSGHAVESSLKAIAAPPENSSTIVSPIAETSHVVARSSWFAHSDTTHVGSAADAV